MIDHAGIAHLPGKATLEDTDAGGYLFELETFQHPDHDTETWPPEPNK